MAWILPTYNFILGSFVRFRFIITCRFFIYNLAISFTTFFFLSQCIANALINANNNKELTTFTNRFISRCRAHSIRCAYTPFFILLFICCCCLWEDTIKHMMSLHLTADVCIHTDTHWSQLCEGIYSWTNVCQFCNDSEKWWWNRVSEWLCKRASWYNFVNVCSIIFQFFFFVLCCCWCSLSLW